MTAETKAFQRRFFSSLDDASRLLRLFEFVPNVYLYVKDADGRFVAMNQLLVEIRGGTDQSDFLGKTDVEIHPVYWGRRYREEDRRVIESGREVCQQVWLVPVEKGKLGTFVSSKIPLRDRTGTVIGIAGVMHRLDRDDLSSRARDPLQLATELINRRFGGSLEVSELAAAAGLSVSQLNRRFRASYQMSPSEYLQRVRVHEASRLLSETDLPIGEVALETGFYDQAHLTRMFRKWMGITPADFRRESMRHFER